MKLTIELVPQPCFYSNLRTQVRKAVWDKLRKEVYAQYSYQCGICHVSKVTLHCHEIWEYDDIAHIQKLKGFIALCAMCHHCKHLGLAGILAAEGKLDLKQVEEHFLRVNRCSYEAFKDHEAEAWRIWAQRNTHAWTTDLGPYAALITHTNEPGTPMST